MRLAIPGSDTSISASLTLRICANVKLEPYAAGGLCSSSSATKVDSPKAPSPKLRLPSVTINTLTVQRRHQDVVQLRRSPEIQASFQVQLDQFTIAGAKAVEILLRPELEVVFDDFCRHG